MENEAYILLAISPCSTNRATGLIVPSGFTTVGEMRGQFTASMNAAEIMYQFVTFENELCYNIDTNVCNTILCRNNCANAKTVLFYLMHTSHGNYYMQWC